MYNENGLRVQKTVNGVVTKYTLHGKNVVHIVQGSNELHFFYDAQNKPAIVVFNGVPYSYVKNLQGDIVAILDSNGNKVVEYKYDAWGKPISKTGSMAGTLGKINPFRYRGYVYDEETGLYYLRSRYYDAQQCRFINSDVLYSSNLYSYCENMPIIGVDKDGFAFVCCFDENGFETPFAALSTGIGGGGGCYAIMATDYLLDHQKEARQEIDEYLMFCARILASVYAVIRPLSIEIYAGVEIAQDVGIIQNDCFYLDFRLAGLSKLGSKRFQGGQLEGIVWGVLDIGWQHGTETYHPLLHETPCTCFPAFPNPDCPSALISSINAPYWNLGLGSITEEGFYIKCSISYDVLSLVSKMKKLWIEGGTPIDIFD